MSAQHPSVEKFIPKWLQVVCMTWILAFFSELAAYGQADPMQSPASGGSWVLDGQLSPKKKWIVPAPQSGIIHKLHVSEGDSVQTLQPLAQWDTELAQEELSVANSAYKSALLEADQRNERELALLTAKVRLTELEQSIAANQRFEKSVSNTEIQRQQLQLDQAKLTAAQTDLRQQMLDEKAQEKFSAMELLRRKIERAELRSRMDGQVVELFCKEGQWVSEGTPVAAIIDLRQLRFESLVHWAVASQLSLGSEVSFTPIDISDRSKQADAPESRFSGTVQFVSPELNPITKQVRVIIEIDNADRKLLPGMTGRVAP